MNVSNDGNFQSRIETLIAKMEEARIRLEEDWHQTRFDDVETQIMRAQMEMFDTLIRMFKETFVG